MKSKLLIATLTFNLQLLTLYSSAQNITQVTGFGTNPASLNMYKYVPTGISGAAPLVVALHGCTQNASQYAQQTGWNKLANLHKFYVIYPEQITANNQTNCFNWFDSTKVNKNQGEALSIKQMVDYMIANYSINPSAIYVTGLSAGAGMTVVMLADYPQVFSKGAVMAGLPYKAATSSLYAYSAMSGGVIKTPVQWGALVRSQNPGYTGPFPHVAIFHGSSDLTVNVANATELIKQWTNLNNADQTADFTNNSFEGNSIIQQTIYNDNLNNPVVYYYKITGMGHGISLDTGACPRQGGATATYAIEEHFHSTYRAADFFNILTVPYPIIGAIQVVPSANNVVYSVPSTSGSTYAWTVPTGATIVSGQGTNSITVNFGSTGGTIEVTETTSGNCKKDAAKLNVITCTPVTFTQSPTVCAGHSLTVGTHTYTAGATYHDTLTSHQNCDSIVTTHLTVDTVNATVLLSTSGTTQIMMAQASPATYQWINCSGNTLISGATHQSYTPTASGNYAVIVTQNSCSDTSVCHSIIGLGIGNNDFAGTVTIYPNPSNGIFTISFAQPEFVSGSKMLKQVQHNVSVYNVIGENIYQSEIKNSQLEIDLSKQPKGIYFVQIIEENKNVVNRKIVVQ